MNIISENMLDYCRTAVAFDSCWVLAIIARELYVCRLIPGNVAQHDKMPI